jgi:hypothetical protein
MVDIAVCGNTHFILRRPFSGDGTRREKCEIKVERCLFRIFRILRKPLNSVLSVLRPRVNHQEHQYK